MKTEINFRETSRYIPFLKACGEKLIPLAEYPTSRNTKIWVDESDDWTTVYSLASYERTPATYYDFKHFGDARLSVHIRPEDLTATTRRHLYAFIRQYVPAKQAESIINTARKTFSLPPMSKDKYTNEPIYEIEFEVYPE